MDGVLSPVHRKKMKYIFWDLYSSAIAILIIETSVFSSWIVYNSIMLWSYYENEGKTTRDLISEESGIHVPKPLIPHNAMYSLLLIGFTFCLLINFFLFLGTVWLFNEFLHLWYRGCVGSIVYLTLVLLIDGIFARYTFPYELVFMPIRCYFIFLIKALSQITDDAQHDYDYKKFAEDHFQTTGTEFVASKKKEAPSSWDGGWRLLLGFCGFPYRKSSKVAPANFSNQRTVIRNMYGDMDMETSSDIREYTNQVEAAEEILADATELPGPPVTILISNLQG